MFDFIQEHEFTPLDEEAAEFMVSLAVDMKTRSYQLPEDLRNMVEIGANNIMKLTAMTMASYYLYGEFKKHADKLYDDLTTSLIILDKVRPEVASIIREGASAAYETFMEEDKVYDG